MTAHNGHDGKRDRETPTYVQMDGHLVEIPSTDEMLRKVHEHRRKTQPVAAGSQDRADERRELPAAVFDVPRVPIGLIIRLAFVMAGAPLLLWLISWAVSDPAVMITVLPMFIVGGLHLLRAAFEHAESWLRCSRLTLRRPEPGARITNLPRALGVEEDGSH